MCGISGFIDFNFKSTGDILSEMSNSLVHRGPDACGNFLAEKPSCQIGLAHQRLSIIDLHDSGKQPMRYQNLIILFNGEVYNYQEIKKELQEIGHSFVGNSDTEVVLHAFSKWGIRALDKFIGMFAFALYDEADEIVYFVRDRTGVKPLYYYEKAGLFLFASELKAFHKHPLFKPTINNSALAAYLNYGNIPHEACIFDGCHKLPPAHYLKLNIKTKEIEKSKYWNVYNCYNKPKLDITLEEAQLKTEKLLNSAFSYRMVADVPVGIFLSGGYDSACLTALLQKNSGKKLNTFTVSVPEMGLNEAPFAREIANYLGTNHTEITCDEKQAQQLIDLIPYYYDEPFADSSAVPTMLVSKMAQQHVKVALSADGGDEVFAGYNRYDYLMRYGKALNNTPTFIRKSLYTFLNSIPSDSIPHFRNKYNFHNRYEKFKNLLLNPSAQNIMLNLSLQFNPNQLKKILPVPYSEIYTPYLSKELKNEYFSPLSYMMAIDYQTYLPDDILQKVDRASMAFSLEAREPYLDHRIIEWVAQLPDNFKYHNGEKKYLLKKITHKYIPQKIMDRPKMGFAIPVEKWLLEPLKDKVFTYLNEDKINTHQFFNMAEINRIKKEFYSGKKEFGVKIWQLLMYAMWQDKWLK